MDFGLPSGTLWLDRLVGAYNSLSPGLYYQWGSIVGHTATDGYIFDAASYREQGLDAISTDLSESQDAARAFYGNVARIPTLDQVRELSQNTSAQTVQPNVIKLTSLINGKSIYLHIGGYIAGSQLSETDKLWGWIRTYYGEDHGLSVTSREDSITSSVARDRVQGLNLMAVHS